MAIFITLSYIFIFSGGFFLARAIQWKDKLCVIGSIILLLCGIGMALINHLT